MRTSLKIASGLKLFLKQEVNAVFCRAGMLRLLFNPSPKALLS